MKAPQFLGGALAMALTVSACQKQTSQAELKQTAGETADRIRTESVKAGEKLEDGWLTTKIQAKFVGDRDIKARNINVSTNDGVVTLKGHVLNESEHQLALTLAKNTDGVKEVVDNLDVQVAGPPPTKPVTGATPGAAPTTGNSTSTPAAPASIAGSDDVRIITSIQSKYFMDDRIKGRHINVTTNSGVVSTAPAGTPAAMFLGAFGPTGYLTFVKMFELVGGLFVMIPPLMPFSRSIGRIRWRIWLPWAVFRTQFATRNCTKR